MGADTAERECEGKKRDSRFLDLGVSLVIAGLWRRESTELVPFLFLKHAKRGTIGPLVEAKREVVDSVELGKNIEVLSGDHTVIEINILAGELK